LRRARTCRISRGTVATVHFGVTGGARECEVDASQTQLDGREMPPLTEASRDATQALKKGSDANKIRFFVANDRVGTGCFTTDRLLWVWLYRWWPRCLDAMVLVKPATVIQWHRQGFRPYWHWRSRSGRPSVDREDRNLIREMRASEAVVSPAWRLDELSGIARGSNAGSAYTVGNIRRRPSPRAR